jgi:hypothetical protein
MGTTMNVKPIAWIVEQKDQFGSVEKKIQIVKPSWSAGVTAIPLYPFPPVSIGNRQEPCPWCGQVHKEQAASL